MPLRWRRTTRSSRSSRRWRALRENKRETLTLFDCPTSPSIACTAHKFPGAYSLPCRINGMSTCKSLVKLTLAHTPKTCVLFVLEWSPESICKADRERAHGIMWMSMWISRRTFKVSCNLQFHPPLLLVEGPSFGLLIPHCKRTSTSSKSETLTAALRRTRGRAMEW